MYDNGYYHNRRFIEDKNPWFMQESKSKGESTLLATAEMAHLQIGGFHISILIKILMKKLIWHIKHHYENHKHVKMMAMRTEYPALPDGSLRLPTEEGGEVQLVWTPQGQTSAGAVDQNRQTSP